MLRQFILLLFLLPAANAAETEPLQFNRDVRPILADKCYACHGFDANKRKAKLRLDTSDATAERDGGFAIKPGSPERSLVWQRITTTNPDERMPPADSHKRLDEEDEALIRRWIEEGANYEKHWAFLPPRKVDPPEVERSEWPRNPIDYFILARLEREGLSPAPEAEPARLLRRVSLDLTGLPPPLEQLPTFSATNYTDWVDQLLTSRDHAERRAQDWFDLARYADTRGFADDKPREIWPWRDWVIRAFERNQAFDEFTIEQLAGDLLPDASAEQRLATAFHRNAPQARGQTYPEEEYRLKGVSDRVNTTGKVWFGLTVECAECHDHKFDPFSQRDYFAMFALFNNIEHQGRDMSQGGPTMAYRFAPPTAAPKALPPVVPELLGAWHGAAVEKDADSFSVVGDLTITARIRSKQAVADLVSKYDWRGQQRAFVFGIGGQGEKDATPGHLYFWASSERHPFRGVVVYGSIPVNDGRPHDVAVVFEAGKSVRLFVDGIEDKAATVRGAPPSSIAVSNRRLAIGSGYNNNEKAEAFRFKGDLTAVRLYERALKLSELGVVDPAVTYPAVKALPIMRERATPRDTFIHVRGNFLERGDKVNPGAPSLFAVPESEQPRDRLAFARWLVNGDNPLVARVVVNRFWQGYFSHGLVRSADDFGAQGSPPSHPELLDWLAREFVDSGWDQRHIHRLIVTSATYRQAARIPPELAERDPENRLLARMPRLRLPAEQIRDQALAVSGLLSPAPPGPAVFPEHPNNYWEDRDLPGKWKTSKGPDLHRKSLYTYWRRMALHPTMEILDAPARAVCVVKRNRANLPTQALVTLNDPIFREAALHLAERLAHADDGIAEGFHRCLSRAPAPAEREKFQTFFAQQKTRYAEDHAAAKALTGSEDAELAAWTGVATVLLNLDETLTRP